MQRYTKSIVYWDASIEFFLIPLLLIVGISLYMVCLALIMLRYLTSDVILMALFSTVETFLSEQRRL